MFLVRVKCFLSLSAASCLFLASKQDDNVDRFPMKLGLRFGYFVGRAVDPQPTQLKVHLLEPQHWFSRILTDWVALCILS